MNKPILIAAALVVLIVGGAIGYFYWRQAHPTGVAAEQARTPPPAAAAPSAEPAVRNPIPEPSPASDLASMPLPTLAESDVPMHDALANIVGPASIETF